MKFCNDCEREKEDSEFHKNQKVCKGCKADRHKIAYANNKQLYLDRNAIRREKFRTIVSEIKSELSCEHCGESHEAVLDFHHEDPNKKDFNIGQFTSVKFPSEKNVKLLNEEIAKCKVLCSNCHRKVHWYESHDKE